MMVAASGREIEASQRQSAFSGQYALLMEHPEAAAAF